MPGVVEAENLPRLGRGVEHTNTRMSHAEMRKAFFWLRDQAVSSLLMAKQMQKMGVPSRIQTMEALAYLEAAKAMFPMTRDGESVSIESILNGQVPAERDPREKES